MTEYRKLSRERREDMRLNGDLAAVAARNDIERQILNVRDLLHGNYQTKGQPWQDYRDTWSRLVQRWCRLQGTIA
jgi:hypothetical protein